MKKQKKSAKKSSSNSVYAVLALSVGATLIVVGFLALWAHNHVSNMVKTELAAQKIYFPEKGSPNFSAEDYPDLQKYAGQLVDTPQEAKAYANGYIGHHLQGVADGKVYSEVSTLARKDPKNQELAAQKEQLFMGETLRGMLLSNGYGFGTVGQLAGYASVVFLAAGALLVGASVYFRARS